MPSNFVGRTVNNTQGRSESTDSARPSVRELTTLAATGLAQMWDDEKQLFCFRLKQTPQGMVRQGHSRRYTIICLLGLSRLETAEPKCSPIGIRTALDGLRRNAACIDNIGDLGLLLWLFAISFPEHLEAVYSDRDVKGALTRFREAREGRTMDLAWFLSGLAHAALAQRQELPDSTELALKTYRLLKKNQGGKGYFGHLARSRSFAGALRGCIGSFADQVYPIYALTKFAQAYGNRTALDMARNCAEALCRVQGPLGQWWWHYDAWTGKVFQRHPVYSVHQHGMAPMALFALGEATGLDLSEPIYKGLRWVYGNNELNRNLRDASSNVIWRSIYHSKNCKMYYREFLNFLRPIEKPELSDDLRISFECRPYEFGWLLYAFAGRDFD